MGLFNEEKKGRLGVFSVYDTKGQVFMTPFFSINNGTAIRSFEQLVNDAQSLPSKYPEDFNLFRLGTFDDFNGTLIPESPMSLGVGISFVKKPATGN